MLARVRTGLAQFRHDLRSPLPEYDGLSRRERWKLRARMLVGKYGWKLALGIFVFYLVRDLALYVLLPYLALTFVW